jgi:hypothetical protein
LSGTLIDCAGVCGGSSVEDECGVCDGSGIASDECDCAGNVEDECGVCNGSGMASGACDCDGNVLDGCGVCGGMDDVDCFGDCNATFSAGTWLNQNAYAINGETPLLSGSADDGSWNLSTCMYTGGEQISNDDGTITVTSMYGAADVHACSFSSADYNGIVTATNISTHDSSTYAVIGEISFEMVGNNFSSQGMGTFTEMTGDGSLTGNLAGGSSGGVVADCEGTCGGAVVETQCGCNEPAPAIYCLDQDEDGLGDSNNEILACSVPDGYVGNCDDGEPECVTNNTDSCGVCGGSGPAQHHDCEGNCLAAVDECGTCDDDASNDCVMDCNGDWGGSAVDDACGDCGGSGPEQHYDCNGNCLETVDQCGTCDDDPNNDCVQDCALVWGGEAVEDCEGTCGGDVVIDCEDTCALTIFNSFTTTCVLTIYNNITTTCALTIFNSFTTPN